MPHSWPDLTKPATALARLQNQAANPETSPKLGAPRCPAGHHSPVCPAAAAQLRELSTSTPIERWQRLLSIAWVSLLWALPTLAPQWYQVGGPVGVHAHTRTCVRVWAWRRRAMSHRCC